VIQRLEFQNINAPSFDVRVYDIKEGPLKPGQLSREMAMSDLKRLSNAEFDRDIVEAFQL
jgi:hypothetical protein